MTIKCWFGKHEWIYLDDVGCSGKREWKALYTCVVFGFFMKRLFIILVVLLIAGCSFTETSEPVVREVIESNLTTLNGTIIITAFNVSGDAGIVKNDDFVMMFDAGREKDKANALLNMMGVGYINMSIASHLDADHIGGFQKIFQNKPSGGFYYPSTLECESKTCEDLFSEMKFKVRKFPVNQTGEFEVNGMRVKVYAPFQNASFSDSNSNSLVMSVSYGIIDYLFMGDCTKDCEREILKQGIGQHEIIKVGHHGSKTSSSEEFIKAINPKECIISTDGNYDHPDPETLDVLEKYCETIHITKDDGNIYIKIQPQGYQILYQK